MNHHSPEHLTVLLRQAAEGDRHAEEAVFNELMPHLRAIAGRMLQNEKPGTTLQATMLVNEAFLKQRLGSQVFDSLESRQHFLNAMGLIMRRLLIDRARYKKAEVHGGNSTFERFEEIDIPLEREFSAEQMEAVAKALDVLRREEPDVAVVVELKALIGKTNEVVASVLGIGETTVKKRWNYGRARLLAIVEGMR
jgi:RNA polymerase sigma factor (TIGR02999 family)